MQRRYIIGGLAALSVSPALGAGKVTTTIDIRGEVGDVTVSPATGGGLEITAPRLDKLFIDSAQAAQLADGMGVEPAPVPPVMESILLINGDSNALAVRDGVTLAQSWGKRVAVARGLTLVNTAVGGHTTAQMKAHWAADLAAHNAGAVAIMMSANDSFQGITPAQGKANMIEMIDMAQQTGANVTVLMHPPFFHDSAAWLHGVGKEVYAFMKEIGGMPEVQYVDPFDYMMRHLFYSGYNGQLSSENNPIIAALYAPSYANPLIPDWIHFSAFGQNMVVEPVMMNPRACAMPM